MSESVEEAQQRYIDGLHAMQSGVATLMTIDKNQTSGKHLRVGVNSAMLQNGALVKLLIDKGVFTEQEWYSTLADFAERERDSYVELLQPHFGGAKINLA